MGLVVVKELGLGLNSRRRRPGQRETTTTTRPGRILIFHEPEFSIFRNKISFPGSTLRLDINQLRLYDLLQPIHISMTIFSITRASATRFHQNINEKSVGHVIGPVQVIFARIFKMIMTTSPVIYRLFYSVSVAIRYKHIKFRDCGIRIQDF